MKYFILTLKIENEGFPHVISKYLINKDEKDLLKKYLEKDFFFQIIEENFTLNCNNDTLSYEFEDNEKHIDAFKILFKNNFFTIDVLDIIKHKIDKKEFDTPKKPENKDDIFNMDDDPDINYYLTTKKNTPEFRNLDDDKMRQYILEAKKTVNLFKPVKN